MCQFCGGRLYENANGDIVCSHCNESLDRMELEQSFEELEASIRQTEGVEPPDLEAPHDEWGRHPQHPHLIWVECEPHHGSYLVTSPAMKGCEVLLSGDDVAAMLGDQNKGEEEDEPPQEGYVSDEYLESFYVTRED